MAAQGGTFTKEKIFVTEIPSIATSVSIEAYTESTISSVYRDAPENGVSFIIIPGSSALHLSFALNAPRYEMFAEYKVAAPVSDYVTAFKNSLPKSAMGNVVFSCNCILNYLYSELEGKRTGSITGPITFGEIAYQLLNQTLAYATIQDVRC